MRRYIDRLKSTCAPLDNPYLCSLRDGSMSRDDFVETQIQFLFAVVFFGRPMAVLAGRLPRPEMRISLLGNVHDELGSGDLSLSHERTFLAFLARFGVTLEEIERRALWPEVRAFNTVLAGVCTLDDTPTATAALGIVEDLFASISSAIGQAVVERGWLRREDLVHYTTHEVLDVTHAEGFYGQLDRLYDSHPRHAYQIDQGLELGAYAFLRMYEDLHKARGRRRMREVSGPHSLAEGWHLERSGS
ncbi:MAG TPA: iron-containing redox enzyme family protein [Vulgatibacter sp.]